MANDFTNEFLIEENSKFKIKITKLYEGNTEQRRKEKIVKEKKTLFTTRKLYADGSQSHWWFYKRWMQQRKDSLIEHVSRCELQGCEVNEF